ncbi:hypothetical protein BGX31_004113, partial [Mortierella sp. GBA43]
SQVEDILFKATPKRQLKVTLQASATIKYELANGLVVRIQACQSTLFATVFPTALYYEPQYDILIQHYQLPASTIQYILGLKDAVITGQPALSIPLPEDDHQDTCELASGTIRS